MSRLESFAKVDWDFANAPVSTGVHAIHPYPAKFIPQIPRQLIRLFRPADHAVLLDPFCGSGTTLVEAAAVGIDAWGIDLHPLACLISRVKTTPLPYTFDDTVRQVVTQAKARALAGDTPIPSIPRLDHWFKSDIQNALAALVHEIKQQHAVPVREGLQVALSSIIVRVSNQESDTRYAAIDKDVKFANVFDHFHRSASNISRAVSKLSGTMFHQPGKTMVLNRDVLGVSPDELPRNVGLVITSPPYPNAYEYWLYHKYRMYWLGMDPIAVREREIGARPHYFKKNHQDETHFQRQMEVCFQLLSQVMLPKTKACFLVGRSIIHGREINNVDLLQRAALPYDFSIEEVVERDIPATRKTFNPAHSKINREHLLVFSYRG